MIGTPPILHLLAIASMTVGATRPAVVGGAMALDLDGDGRLAVADERVAFDLDGDGAREPRGWIEGSDALLVLDGNADGRIDRGSELVGVGFALPTLDANGDAVVDAKDPAFARLLLWCDRNGDGVAIARELTGLGRSGIASLELEAIAYAPKLHLTPDGRVRVMREGRARRTDGRRLRLLEVELETVGLR